MAVVVYKLAPPAGGGSDHFTLGYDGLERLTTIAGPVAETFTLDGGSNITARTGPTKTFSIDGSNRPTSDGTNTLTWNNADRLTGRGADSFGFDPLDRLTSSTVAGTARTYAYSGDGLLQSRTQGGSTTTLLWDPATSPSRLLISGNDRIVYGLGPLYSVNGSTVTTLARDGQKSIRAQLSGTSVSASWRYRAYGEIAQSSGAATPSLLGYAGQLLDPSGLYYMRARWYDATNARFMSSDPLSGTASEMRSNRFGYAGASPVTAYDPTGLLRERLISDDGLISPDAGPTSPSSSLLERLTNKFLFGARATFDTRDGVTIVSDAEGVLGNLVSALNLGRGSTTFSSTLIVSSDEPDSRRLQHEFGHVSQARDFGLAYLPAYIAGAFTIPVIALYERLGGHPISAHDAHPMEQDANQRAGLGSLWTFGRGRP